MTRRSGFKVQSQPGEVFVLSKIICEFGNYDYVGSMNWQQFLPIVLILGVAFVVVWRSSGQKKHVHGENCGCDHHHGPEADKKNPAPR
jgi:hypothetical protein